MSNKLSKSNLGPDYEARVMASMAKDKPKCMHFALGTGVLYNRVFYTVEHYHGNWVNLRADDGTLKMLRRPYFMRNSNVN